MHMINTVERHKATCLVLQRQVILSVMQHAARHHDRVEVHTCGPVSMQKACQSFQMCQLERMLLRMQCCGSPVKS